MTDWGKALARDDSVTVILKREALKNPVCQRIAPLHPAVLRTGSFADAQDDRCFVILGKYATAAGGRKKERVCGGGTELKDAR